MTLAKSTRTGSTGPGRDRQVSNRPPLIPLPLPPEAMGSDMRITTAPKQ